MSTRSSARNLFPPLDNPELTIQRRSRTDPTLLNNSELAAEGNGDLLVPDLRTMEELSQPCLNGRGGLIAPITIQSTNFRPKNDMIQQVQNSCQFHGLPGDDANKHLDKFLHVTQSIKVNGVTDDALHLYLFPHSLTHYATACNEITNFRQRPDESLFEVWERYKLLIDRCPNHNMLPVTQIDTFYNGLTLRHCDTINAAAGETFMKRRPEECYDLIENMTAHHNDWDTSAQRSESSTSITSSSNTEIAALKAEMAEINKNLMRPPLATLRTYMMREPIKFMKMNTASSSGSGTLLGNTITNPKEDLKERETEATKDMMHPTNNGSTQDVQPPVVQTKYPILNSEPVVAHIIEPVASPAITFNLDQTLRYSANYNDMTANRIDVIDMDYEEYSQEVLGELTLRVGKEAITFNLDQTLRYSANYNDMTENRIDVIDMDYEEYSQEVLGFFDVIASGNPTPYFDLIVSTTSPTLTPFGNSDFLLKEVDALLALEDDPTLPEVDQSYVDIEGDILLLEAFLIDDPSLPPLNQGNYMPQVRKELKIYEAKSKKSLIGEPPEVKLKDLPPHLEYGIDPEFCTHKILMEEDFELAIQHQRRVNPKIHDVIKNEIPIDPKDQEKTTFTFPYGMFAYRHMPFGLCNASSTFQRCMMAIFHDMIEKTMEVFMDDFLVFRNSFQTCLSHLERMLKRCEDTNLCLNWEKNYFMVKEGIVLSHNISKVGIEVDKAKVDVIVKLPHPITVKGIRSFLGHVSFYQRFIQDFLKIARSMTRLLEKDTPFFFSKECIKSFQTLKRKLTEAPILIAPD
nr:reverse transcriptase domain-containing protein [Tanacetum cinerariifolium]